MDFLLSPFFLCKVWLTKFKMMSVTGNDEDGVRMERADAQEDLVWWNIFYLKLDDGKTSLNVLNIA